MKRLFGLICAGCLLTEMGQAQSPVTVTLAAPAQPASAAIPADFVGLSFESSNLLPDAQGKHLFSAENKRLVTLFRTIGISNLRVGGATAEMPRYRIPGPADIDALFAFARAADVRVIYTLRLLNGDKVAAAATAKYIADRYPRQLVCFALGNEPDWRSYHNQDPAITDYPSYLARWREFAASVAEAAPSAELAGPDTGSNYPVPRAVDTDYNGKSWTRCFAEDEGRSGKLAAIFQHDYVGQKAEGVSIPTAVDAMLSRNWPAIHYPALYDAVLAPVLADGLGYRMTECNDYTGGVDGASNAFVSALWALDYLHWHAARHALGVNLHNKRWIPTCTILPNPAGRLHANPKAYGLKAFALGSQGSTEPLTLSNTGGLNLTAYAVRGVKQHFVTLINKEHGPGAREAEVTVAASGRSRQAAVMYLTAPHGELTTKTGVTLGGASLSDNGLWRGKWKRLGSGKTGQWTVNLPFAAAALVRISTE